MNLNDLVAENFAHLFNHILIVGLFAVKLIEGKDYGLLEAGGGAELILRAHLDSILRVDHNNGRIGDIQSRNSRADKVISARAVNEVQLATKKLSVKYSGKYGIAIFLFNGEIVADGIAGVDCATAFYNSTLVEHSLGECGFSGALAAKQGNVFDFVGFVDFHSGIGI